MAVSYNKLYKVLEEKNITMVELRKAADIRMKKFHWMS